MLAEGLYSFLAAAASLTALLGTPSSRTDGTSGIFPVQMPEATVMPAIVITQIAGQGNPVMEGADPLHTARVQFSCYGKSFADAKKLSTTLRRYLEGWQGTLPDKSEVDSVILVLESDGFEVAPFIFHCPIDFEISYRDTGD